MTNVFWYAKIRLDFGGIDMNFKHLSAEGYAAFVLAIIFSIVTLASIIYFLKHKESGKLVAILTTIVFPTLATFCWVYLIMNVFAYPIDISLYVALGSSIGYLLLSIALAFVIVAIIKSHKNRAEKVVEETATETDETETDEAEETPEEVPATLLIAPAEETVENEESEEVVEEVENAEETVEETTETEIVENNEEIVEEVEQTEEVEESENAEETEQGVIFSNKVKKTFAEAIADLDEEQLKFYNEVLEYAQSKEKTKTKEAKYQLTVSIGRMKLVLFKFIREKLTSCFMASASELKNYSAKEKAVKIKEKPILIEIDSEDSVAVAKNMVDIVYKNILDAKEEKKANETIATVAEIKQSEEMAEENNFEDLVEVENNDEE